ncbi:hypothetical protein RHMOL_Rhmol10G0142600 [Rhododendron molle]|uniref:Uncharacterized protein n=1 Tax=Rhododendron molle TaxID=49168 RepID=A0ACC0M364_RHOML|nr:hypothetical protein RHMOL_Rhmol10G0142600 [Rhododendron molle]
MLQQELHLTKRSLYDWELVSLTELRNLLDNSGVAASLDSPDKLVWQGCASVKTSEFLLRIGILHSVEDALCRFCKANIESLDHLLLLCGPVGDRV